MATALTHLDRDTLIRLEREMRGKPGVGVIRAHLRKQIHEALAAAIDAREPGEIPAELMERFRADTAEQWAKLERFKTARGFVESAMPRMTEVVKERIAEIIQRPLVLRPEWRTP